MGRHVLLMALAGMASALPQARAVDGLRFHASFDRWMAADVAAGGRMPVRRLGGRLGPGLRGRALVLDGRSYLEFPAGANLGREGCTIALWFRPDRWGAATYDNILGLSDSDTNALHLERAHPGGQLRLVLGGPGTASGGQTRSLFSQAALRDGEWVHVAAAWDRARGHAELFVNGQLAARLSEPGPLPLDPPSILVGCGFGRLARAVVGRIDELAILDHAATAEEVQALMQGIASSTPTVELSNAALHVQIDPGAGTLTIGDRGEAGGRLLLGPARPSVHANGRELSWAGVTPEGGLPLAPRLGTATHRVFAARHPEMPLRLRWHVQVQHDRPLALSWVEVINEGLEPVTLSEIGVLCTAAEGGLSLGAAPERLRVFIDSGGLTGSGSRRLAAKDADHAAHGALVVVDPADGSACSLSFLSFETAGVTNRIRTDGQGHSASAEAVCAYPNGCVLAPGATLRSEVAAVGIYPSGHEALERWADAVVALNDIAPPRHCPSGWNSWYAYRLTITEDIVLQNARVIRERFAPLGVTNLQIDHGWQYQDVVGHWVPNERFPHGLQWLSARLKEMGFSLGLWTAVSQVSEHAPLYREHPEALFHDAQGAPFVADAHWYWVPHGRTFTLDPTHPLGEEAYRRAGAALRGYGCRYVKNDFQGNLLETSAVPHDGALTRGTPIYRKAMAAFREGMGRDMAYHACNAPLNVAAGLCDAAWVHRDLGNPAANWAHLRAWANDFACRYHVSGKFYWSDPDYLQVGQGSLDETRIRMAFVALGGGPAFLSDRLPELPEERLALIPKCLPSYRHTARPLDLFTSDEYPRVWALPVRAPWGRWHVVGLFNLDEQPARLELDLRDLGIPEGRPVLVYDFFEEKLLGEVGGITGMDVVLRLPVPAGSVRVLKVVPKEPRPFVLSTDMHLTQGGVELPKVAWDAKTLTLRGIARRAPGMSGRVVVYVPPGFAPAGRSGKVAGRLLSLPIAFALRDAEWSVAFRRQWQ